MSPDSPVSLGPGLQASGVSSEEEARVALHQCRVPDCAIEVKLDAYKTAIERRCSEHSVERVLAQQPCYGCGELPCVGVDHRMFRCCDQKQPSDRCGPCQARAAQTTAGLPGQGSAVEQGNAQETSGSSC